MLQPAARTARKEQMMSEVFDFDAAVAEARREPFPFKAHGREWHLTHIFEMDLRTAALAEQGQQEAVIDLFRDGFGDQWDEWQKHPQPMIGMIKLLAAWMKHGGVNPGELLASSGSSKSTAGPSTRRSAPGTGSRSGRRSPAKSAPANS